MTDIGIKGLVTKNVTEMNDLITMFIKSSLNMREDISVGKDPEVCMLILICDTYMCNLILRYIGMMTLLSPDPKWNTYDNKMMDYIQNYYNNDKFKNKLLNLYEYYLKTFDEKQINFDYCRFLDKMIKKGEISKKGVEIRKMVRMIENRVFNILNMNPIVKIATKYFKAVPQHCETKHGKAEISLTKANYHALIDIIEDIPIRHQIEAHYISRTNNTLIDFSKLIVLRKMLAEQTGYSTYFKYINRGKYDNTDSIKEFLTDLDSKINNKFRSEIDRIHQFFTRSHENKSLKISSSDVTKYVRAHRNDTKFEPKHVFYVIFHVLDKYFNIILEKIETPTWRQNVVVYNIIDKYTRKILGRLYLDIIFDENKKTNDPISIRLSDKMQISVSDRTIAEVALITNYKNTKCMTYADVILLFREFGYVIGNVCYDSRVGLVNYDEEFSNYLPALMEYIAWDRDTITMVAHNMDSSIIDHIEMGRELDMFYNIKMKCINAKFDHLLHNSEPLLNIIIEDINIKNDASAKIFETYKDIFTEMMSPVSSVFANNVFSIDPSMIVQEINSSQGVLYSNLMNDIFAYATFWIMKDRGNNMNVNIVNDFRTCVLDNGVDNYRDLMRTFLKKVDVNCFTLYKKNVIKIDSIEDYVTEDTNYFDENGESESDSDQDDGIQITLI